VTTGPFKHWIDHHTAISITPAAPTCLSRGINWNIHSQGGLTGAVRLQEIIATNDKYSFVSGGYTRGFRPTLEGTPHANPHNLLGGHIRSFSSPADPIFFRQVRSLNTSLDTSRRVTATSLPRHCHVTRPNEPAPLLQPPRLHRHCYVTPRHSH